MRYTFHNILFIRYRYEYYCSLKKLQNMFEVLKKKKKKKGKKKKNTDVLVHDSISIFFLLFFFERLWVLCTHIMHLYVGIQYISYHLVMSTLYNLATLGSPVYVQDSPVDTPSSCTERWAQMSILVLCLISINQAITTSDSLTTYPIILATRKSSHKLQLQCQSV